MVDNLMLALRAAVGKYDENTSKCPVRRSPKVMEKCPDCGACRTDYCGIDVMEVYNLLQTVRHISSLGGDNACSDDRA